MFRSKGFTIAFCFLSVLILALAAIFCYLIFGRGSNALIEEYKEIANRTETETETEPVSDTEPSTTESDTETEPEPSTEETEPTVNTAEDYTIRALYSYEPHTYPVAGEDIPERGVLTIIKSGDAGEGLVFHKKPAFDHEKTPGNQTIYSGTFNITDKVYIIDHDRPYVMYKTEDEYYVTGSTTYVTYESGSEPIVTPNKKKVTTYGMSENEGIVITVFYEDGNHVVFSVFNYIDGRTEPVLENVIAKYQDNGTARFEYHNKDGVNYGGVLNFESITDSDVYSYRVQLVLDSAIEFGIGERNDIVLHNN